MKGHVSEEEMIDLLEDEGGAAAAHVAGCAGCAARLGEARELLAAARGVEVPEPPALFWQAFRRNVQRKIAGERPRVSLLRWLVPAAAMAAVAVALAGPGLWGRKPPAVPPVGRQVVAAWSALPPAEEDEALAVLEGVAVTSGEAAWDEGLGLGPFLAGLTDEESLALAEALGKPAQEVKL